MIKTVENNYISEKEEMKISNVHSLKNSPKRVS
jgi:hypothetical protein